MTTVQFCQEAQRQFNERSWYTKRVNTCLSCGKKPERSFYKYCSNACQQEYQYKDYIRRWKLGLVNGDRGIVTKNISAYIRRYLLEKYGEKCAICKWNKKHIITGRVPLEVDHINGNASDNNEKNLRFICPNCHSLSLNFRNLNRGKGRSWRMKKYLRAGFA